MNNNDNGTGNDHYEFNINDYTYNIQKAINFKKTDINQLLFGQYININHNDERLHENMKIIKKYVLSESFPKSQMKSIRMSYNEI
jgi:hypothetical protein